MSIRTVLQSFLGDLAFQSRKTLVLEPQASIVPRGNEELSFERISNTVVRLNYRGTDGVLRFIDFNVSDSLP